MAFAVAAALYVMSPVYCVAAVYVSSVEIAIVVIVEFVASVLVFTTLEKYAQETRQADVKALAGSGLHWGFLG